MAVSELATDTAIVDWLADTRVFDGFSGVDIDDVCLSMMPEVTQPYDEEERIWKETWRKALRKVVTGLIEADVERIAKQL
jgi:hypothetical protein